METEARSASPQDVNSNRKSAKDESENGAEKCEFPSMDGNERTFAENGDALQFDSDTASDNASLGRTSSSGDRRASAEKAYEGGDEESAHGGGGQDSGEETAHSLPAETAATDKENDTTLAEPSEDTADSAQDNNNLNGAQTLEPAKKKAGIFSKFMRRFSKGSDKEELIQQQKQQRMAMLEQKLKEVTVDGLPQIFVTKYLGSKPCKGLWGITNIREPVDSLIAEVASFKEGDDLPLVQLRISSSGIHVREHSSNTSKTKVVEKGLIPIEFISYAVQDIKYTRVFCFILVREMSSRNRSLECHAYVSDSTISGRKLALSVSLAFKEYAKTLEGKPHKFQVDLRPATELADDLDDASMPIAEDFEA